jgi:DNA-binding protein Fis
MPRTSANEKLYDILKDITGKSHAEVNLEDLKNFNTDNILLNTVMPKTSGNVKLYDILKDITGKDYTSVSLYDLKVFKTEKILLNTVMPKTSANTKLYDILKDITNKDYTEVSLGDLESFNTDNILLNTVVPYDAEKNGKLYAVLKDVTGYDYTGVKISMLQNFDPLKIKLETVLEKGDNNILNALLDKGGTLGTMDENVSTLTLYEVYKETCFTTDMEYTNDLSKKYKLSVVDGKDVYTLDADGEYYLNVNPGVWLIMCFDGNAKETADGVSTVFTESVLTLGDMQASGNKLNERIQNATIRELISAGIMPNVEFSNEEIYHMTFEEFIELASSML